MKFKAIFYPIFCFAITISLAIFLVVKNNIDKARTEETSTATMPVNSGDNTEDSNHDDEISIILMTQTAVTLQIINLTIKILIKMIIPLRQQMNLK